MPALVGGGPVWLYRCPSFLVISLFVKPSLLIGEPGAGKTSITEGAREHGPALQAVVMGMYR